MFSRNEKLPNRSPDMCIIIYHQNRHADLLSHSYSLLPNIYMLCFGENKTGMAKSKITYSEYVSVHFDVFMHFGKIQYAC